MRRSLTYIALTAALVLLGSCARSGSVTNSAQQTAQKTTRVIVAEQNWLQARWLTRDAVLSDLSANHRVLLGRLIGELSVAPEPDVAQAVRMLDAALDGKEKSSIAWAGRALQKSWQPLWDAERVEFAGRNPPVMASGQHLSADPGALLLNLTMNSIAFRTSVAIRQNAHAEPGQASR